MTRILKEVLAKDERMRKNTDSYIDDIIVREEGITVEEVAAHLRRYGLESKPPEGLEGGWVLGISIHRNANRELIFSRGNELPDPEELEGLSRRQLFSVCGRLVGHYPICGWLRVTCSFAKRESRKSFGMIMSVGGQRVLSKIFCVELRKRILLLVTGWWQTLIKGRCGVMPVA